MPKELLGSKIQLHRKRQGLSQEALAQLMGVSRQAVTKWETGQSAPDLDKLVQLSDVLGLSLDYLLKAGESAVAEETPLPGRENPIPAEGERPAGREAQAAFEQEQAGLGSRLLTLTGYLLLLAGLGGVSALWIFSVVYPVRLTDWDGTRHTGLRAYLMAHDYQPLLAFALFAAVLGGLLLGLAVWRKKRPGASSD